jgi:hypothetical protein
MSSNVRIPESPSTINVSIIDNGSFITGMRGEDYMSSVLPGYEVFDGPVYCFLLHHEQSNTRILFDLGIRVDWKTAYPPESLELFEEIGMAYHAGRDMAEFLQMHSVAAADINSIIFSHHHDDH